MSLWFHRLDKITNEIISEFLPWNFLYLPGGFLEAFWGFLQASLFMILHTKSPGSPKSFHEAPRKLQKNSGQKSRNNFVGIFVQTMKPKGHFEINWPLATENGNSKSQEVFQTIGQILTAAQSLYFASFDLLKSFSCQINEKPKHFYQPYMQRVKRVIRTF